MPAAIQKNSMRGMVEGLIQHETKQNTVFVLRPCLSAIFLRTAQVWQYFNWFKVFRVVWAMGFIWQSCTALIFSHQTISECLYSTGQLSVETGSQLLTRMTRIGKLWNTLRNCVNNTFQVPSNVYSR